MCRLAARRLEWCGEKEGVGLATYSLHHFSICHCSISYLLPSWLVPTIQTYCREITVIATQDPASRPGSVRIWAPKLCATNLLQSSSSGSSSPERLSHRPTERRKKDERNNDNCNERTNKRTNERQRGFRAILIFLLHKLFDFLL